MATDVDVDVSRSVMCDVDVDVVRDDAVNDQSMYHGTSQHQRSAIPTHSRTHPAYTVDEHRDVYEQTLATSDNVECAIGDHRHHTTPPVVDDVHKHDTYSQPLDDSEVQFNPTAIERARLAGQNSRLRSIDTAHQLASDDLWRAEMQAIHLPATGATLVRYQASLLAAPDVSRRRTQPAQCTH
jgi:hypothetical protein